MQNARPIYGPQGTTGFLHQIAFFERLNLKMKIFASDRQNVIYLTLHLRTVA
jgi:hypothetical protein